MKFKMHADSTTTEPFSAMGDFKKMTHPLIPASRVKSSPVYDVNGVRVGSVEDVVLDKVEGKVAYAIIAFGGFLGLGTRYRPIRWGALSFDPGIPGYMVPMTGEVLKASPKLDRKALSGWDDSRDMESVFSYHGPDGVRPE